MVRLLSAVLIGAVALGASAGASTYRTVASSPVWSPDGKHLALVVHVKGTGYNMLEVGNADGQDARVVYSSNDSCCGGPIQWASPSLIVFDDDYNVKTVSLKTGKVTKLRLGFSDFAVSRNGRWIAGWADSGGHVPQTIGIASVTGDRYSELRKPGKKTDDSQPDFSPDGKQLLFNRNDSLVVEPFGGGPVKTLVAHGALPQWSPDGRWIAFVRPTVNPNDETLMLVSSSGGRARLLVHGFFYVFPILFSWSPDSRRLAYVDFTGMLTTIDLNGHRRKLPLGSVTAGSPKWSPDGKRIAFPGTSATPTGRRVDVYVIGADGRGLRRIL
jgi:Tol biopolymer transport system component